MADNRPRITRRDRFKQKLLEFNVKNRECFEAFKASDVFRNCNPKRNSTKNWTPEGVPPEAPKDFIRKFQLFYDPLMEAMNRIIRNLYISDRNEREEIVEFNVTMILIWHRVFLRLNRWMQRKENEERFPIQGKVLCETLNALSEVVRMCEYPVDGMKFLRFPEIDHLDREKSNVYRRKEVAALERQTRMTAARSLGLGRRLNDDQKMLMAIRTALVLQSYKDESLYWQLCRPWGKYVQRYERLHKKIFPPPQVLVLLPDSDEEIELDATMDSENIPPPGSVRTTPARGNPRFSIFYREPRIGDFGAGEAYYQIGPLPSPPRPPPPPRFDPETVRRPGAFQGAPAVPEFIRIGPGALEADRMALGFPEAVRIGPGAPGPVRMAPGVPEAVRMAPRAPDAVRMAPRAPEAVRIAPEVRQAEQRAPESAAAQELQAEDVQMSPEPEEPQIVQPQEVQPAPRPSEVEEAQMANVGAQESFPMAPGAPEPFLMDPRPSEVGAANVGAPEPQIFNPEAVMAPESFRLAPGSIAPLGPAPGVPESHGPSIFNPEAVMAPESFRPAPRPIVPLGPAPGAPESFRMAPDSHGPSMFNPEADMAPEAVSLAPEAPESFQMAPPPPRTYPEVITLGSPEVEILEAPTTSGFVPQPRQWNLEAFRMAPEVITIGSPDIEILENPGPPAATADPMEVDPDEDLFTEFFGAPAPEVATTSEGPVAPEVPLMMQPVFADMSAPESPMTAPEVITLDSPEREDPEDVSESPEGSPNHQEAPESTINESPETEDLEDVAPMEDSQTPPQQCQESPEHVVDRRESSESPEGSPRHQQARESPINEPPRKGDSEDVALLENDQNPSERRQVSPEGSPRRRESSEVLEDVPMAPELLEPLQVSPEDPQHAPRDVTMAPGVLEATKSPEAPSEDVISRESTQSPFGLTSSASTSDEAFVKDFFMWKPPSMLNPAPDVDVSSRQNTESPQTCSGVAPEDMDTSESPEAAPEATTTSSSVREAPESPQLQESAFPEAMDTSESAPQVLPTSEAWTSSEAAPEVMDTLEPSEFSPEVSTSPQPISEALESPEDSPEAAHVAPESQTSTQPISEGSEPSDAAPEVIDTLEPSEISAEAAHVAPEVSVSSQPTFEVSQPSGAPETEDVGDSESNDDEMSDEQGEDSEDVGDSESESDEEEEEDSNSPDDVKEDSEGSRSGDDVQDSEAVRDSESSHDIQEDPQRQAEDSEPVEGLQNPPDSEI